MSEGIGKGVSLMSSHSVQEANNQCSGVDTLTLRITVQDSTCDVETAERAA